MTWADLTTSLLTLTADGTYIGRAADDGSAVMVPGQVIALRVVAVNANGDGEPSDSIDLIPSALPSGPAGIYVTYNDDGSLTLDWDVPADTGGGDQAYVDPSTLYYSFEVNEGFYAEVDDAENFDPLTSVGAEDGAWHTIGDQSSFDLFYLTQYTHTDLIVGHTYTYRVKARNLMGWGAYSAEYQFVPRRVPLAPTRAPWDLTDQKSRTTIFIAFDAVLDNEGDEISAYTVYIDDGLDSDSFTAHVTDTSLAWDSSSSPPGGALILTTGLIYRLKYSATNVAGEGPLSPEV